jgi:hypothetical protein
MSYDLMVFDPNIRFVGEADFMKWYKAQTEWSEDHGYNDPEIPTKALQNWFREMIKKFPPMNGPLANADDDSSYVTDYCLGKGLIYVAFAWSVAEEAHVHFQELAKKVWIGIFRHHQQQGLGSIG